MNENRRTGYDRRNEQVRPATERWFGTNRRNGAERRALLKDPDVTIGRLRLVPLFQDLSMAQYEKVLTITMKRDISDGEVLCSAGESADRLIILVNGALRITFQDGRTVSRMTTKETIGALGFFTDEKHSATVRADSDCTILVISRDELMRIFAADHELWARILGNLVRHLADKIRLTTRNISDMNIESSLEML